MEKLTQKQKITVMFGLMSAMFFAAINQTIVSSAMPRIIAMLGGMEYYAWVMTIFMLTSSIATILVGRLSDIYGRKPFLLAGIVIFMAGTFLTGTSTSIFQMIGYRAIQGIGAGILMSTTTTAVGDLFAPRERAKWTGIMMAIFGFSSVLGPTIGGIMIDNMEWKWLFWAFLPLGVVAFTMIWILFPKATRTTTQSIDYLGSLFLSISIVSILLGFSWAGNKYAWGSPEILGLFGTTIIGVIIFIFVEKRAKSPVMPLSLFKNGTVNISFVVGFLMQAGMMGAMIYLPFFIQGVEGLTPTQSGYVNIPMSLMMVVFSSLAGGWISKSGKYKRYGLLGTTAMLISMLMLVYMLMYANSVPLAVASMAVFGLGIGLSMPVFTLAVQNAVPTSELGVATSSVTLFRNLGGTIGIAIFSSIMNYSLTNKLKEAMASGQGADLSHVDPATAEKITGLLNPQLLLDQPRLTQIEASFPAEMKPMFMQMIEMLRAVLTDTLSLIYIAASVALIIAIALTFLLKELPLRTSNYVAKKDGEKEVS